MLVRALTLHGVGEAFLKEETLSMLDIGGKLEMGHTSILSSTIGSPLVLLPLRF
ncbi:hypothetical protein LINPERHAP1_LOCUS8714 [Linum perenne]